jgi:plastocyanin
MRVQKLLDDRRRVLAVLVTVAVIAVGSVLVFVLAGDSSGGGSGSAGVTTASARSSAGAAAGNVKIDISDFTYLPGTVTVRAGSRVRWVNDDTAPHTATAAGAFDTGALRKGDSKVLTLDKAGSYSYICAFHPFMKGTVVVK